MTQEQIAIIKERNKIFKDLVTKKEWQDDNFETSNREIKDILYNYFDKLK